MLIKQHTEETGLDFDEAAMYEPLVELARGKNIGTLAINSDNGELKYIVNMMYEWWVHNIATSAFDTSHSS